MPRLVRQLLALVEKEVTYNVDPTPLPAANAILLLNPNITPIQANNVDRALVRPYLGGSEQLVGTRTVRFSFDVEFVGSGTLGTAPAWAPLLDACAMQGVSEATFRYDHLPVTDPQDSVQIYLYDSGVLHRFGGARANAALKVVAGELPVISFSFEGLYGAVTAAALPAGASFAAFKTPSIPTDANTVDLTLGATLNAAGAPVLTGGTTVPSLGLEIDLGNAVNFTPLIGGETVDITDRQVTGKVRMDLTAAQEVSRMADVLAATLSSVGIFHGTVNGFRVGLFLPTVQFINPTKEELNGRRLLGYDLRGVPDPAGTGNNEVRVLSSF